MTRLGGFGFVCQIRRDKLLDLMQENGLTVQGNPLVTPFRLTVKSTVSGAPNTVDLLVKSTDLALEVGTNRCTLILRLEGGVIRLPGAPVAAFTGGAVNVQLELLDKVFIIARTHGATLDAPNTPVIAGIANFAKRANAEVDKIVTAEKKVDVDIYPDAGPIKLLFFLTGANKNLDANTFASHTHGADAGTLTPTVDATTSVSYAISTTEILPQLPTPADLSQSHVTVLEVNYAFHDNGIDVTGVFDGNDTCWRVSGGTFSQLLLPLLIGQNFVFIPVPAKPKLDFDLHIKEACLIGLAAIDFLDFTLTQAFFILFGPTFGPALGIKRDFTVPDTPTQTRPGLALGGVIWSEFLVSDEGFILLGDRTGGGVVSASQQAAIHLRTSRTPENLHEVGRGSVVVQGPTCAPMSFDYVRSAQDDQCTLTLETDWVFEPLTYTWTIDGEPLVESSKVVVIGGNGRTPFDFTGTVTEELPPPNGTAIPGHAIKLAYRLAGASLSVFARHDDANYEIRVEVRAVDALGRSFSDAVNIEMRGDIVTLAPEYDTYMDACVKAAADIVNKKGTKSGKGRPGEPQEHWKDFVEALTLAAVEGNIAAQAAIPGIMKAVGSRVVAKSLQRF
ncbi:MAG: hypothetical protein ABJE10_11110 [bacterium]